MNFQHYDQQIGQIALDYSKIKKTINHAFSDRLK